MAKAILFLSDFEVFRFKFGVFYFWVVTNKKDPKFFNDVDTVFENKFAQKGQIKKASLVCVGEQGRAKCHWEFEVAK